MGKTDPRCAMAAKRRRVSEDAAVILAADVQRVPVAGRSPLWASFHRRVGPDGVVAENAYWCNLCCPGLQGQVDNIPVGKFVLTSKATNQLDRHLKAVHKQHAVPVRAGQLKLTQVLPFDKDKNERLLRSFTRNLIIRDLLGTWMIRQRLHLLVCTFGCRATVLPATSVFLARALLVVSGQLSASWSPKVWRGFSETYVRSFGFARGASS